MKKELLAQRVEKGSGQRFIRMGSRIGKSVSDHRGLTEARAVWDGANRRLRSSLDQEVSSTSVRTVIRNMKAAGSTSDFISNVLSLPLQFVRTVRPLPPVAD